MKRLRELFVTVAIVLYAMWIHRCYCSRAKNLVRKRRIMVENLTNLPGQQPKNASFQGCSRLLKIMPAVCNPGAFRVLSKWEQGIKNQESHALALEKPAR